MGEGAKGTDLRTATGQGDPEETAARCQRGTVPEKRSTGGS